MIFRQPRSPFFEDEVAGATRDLYTKVKIEATAWICPFGSEKTSIQGGIWESRGRESTSTRSVQDHKHDDQPTRRERSREEPIGENDFLLALCSAERSELCDIQTDSRVWAFSCPQVRGTKWHEVEAEVS